MPKLLAYFQDKDIEALGIGCFGPVDLDRKSETYGHIMMTPKLAWRGYDICGYFREGLNVPVGFDTDVNGSMLGESTWGCAKGLDTAIYITVGTGVGVGVLAGGKLLHGMQHPEGGHMLIPARKDRGALGSQGNCLGRSAGGVGIGGLLSGLCHYQLYICAKSSKDYCRRGRDAPGTNVPFGAEKGNGNVRRVS